jgi:hypothetical protein
LKWKINEYDAAVIIIGFFLVCIVLFTFSWGDSFNFENNIDSIWMYILGEPLVKAYLLLGFLAFCAVIYLFRIKKLKLTLTRLLVVSMALSMIPASVGITILYQQDQFLKDHKYNDIGVWFNDHEPEATIAFQDKSSYYDTGIHPQSWFQVYVALYFWCPECDIQVVTKEDLWWFTVPPHDKRYDYVATTETLVGEHIMPVETITMYYNNNRTLTWTIYECI